MLGSQYADLYRQTKIQEAVYEFLTQQYEMAKIQEEKDLPMVRVMDVAVPPERKSAPMRSLIVLLSVIGGVVLACFWVVWRNAWAQLPADDSRRQLMAEVMQSVRRARAGAS